MKIPSSLCVLGACLTVVVLLCSCCRKPGGGGPGNESSLTQSDTGGVHALMGRELLLTPEDGMILGGNFGNNSIFLTKRDKYNYGLWANYYSTGNYLSFAGALAMDDEGFSVLANDGFNQPGVFRVDRQGTPYRYGRWSCTWDTGNHTPYPSSFELAKDFVRTADGGYVVAGVVRREAENVEQFYVVRLDANGKPLWGKDIGFKGLADFGSAVHVLGDGNVLVAGHTPGQGGNDIMVCKIGGGTTGGGELHWVRRYAAPGDEIDPHFVKGAATPTLTASSSANVLVLRLDGNGDMTGGTLLSGAGQTAIRAGRAASDGSLLLTGYTTGVPGDSSASLCLVRLEADGGAIRSTSAFGRAGIEDGWSVGERSDHDILAFGSSEGSFLKLDGTQNSKPSVYIVQTNKAGENHCNELSFTLDPQPASVSVMDVNKDDATVFRQRWLAFTEWSDILSVGKLTGLSGGGKSPCTK